MLPFMGVEHLPHHAYHQPDCSKKGVDNKYTLIPENANGEHAPMDADSGGSTEQLDEDPGAASLPSRLTEGLIPEPVIWPGYDWMLAVAITVTDVARTVDLPAKHSTPPRLLHMKRGTNDDYYDHGDIYKRALDLYTQVKRHHESDKDMPCRIRYIDGQDQSRDGALLRDMAWKEAVHASAEYHLYFNWSIGNKVKDIRYGKQWQAPTLDEMGEAFETLMYECKEEFNAYVPMLFDEIRASVWKWMLTDNERMHLNSTWLHWQYVSELMHRTITDTRKLIDMEVSDPDEKIVVKDLINKLMEITDTAIQVSQRARERFHQVSLACLSQAIARRGFPLVSRGAACAEQ